MNHLIQQKPPAYVARLLRTKSKATKEIKRKPYIIEMKPARKQKQQIRRNLKVIEIH